jgi:uridine kinase
MNEIANYQKFDWNERKLTNWFTVKPQDFIIVEGVSSSRREFRQYLSFSIFVKAAAGMRLERGIERDGIDSKDKWLKWMTEENDYINSDNPQKFANLVVSGETTGGDFISVLS